MHAADISKLKIILYRYFFVYCPDIKKVCILLFLEETLEKEHCREPAKWQIKSREKQTDKRTKQTKSR